MKVHASLSRLPWWAQQPRPEPWMQLTSWGGLPGPPPLTLLLSDSIDWGGKGWPAFLLKHQSGHRALASAARGHVDPPPRLLFPTLSPRKAFTCRPLWCHHGPSSPQSEPPDHPADRLLPSTAHPSLPSLDPALSCHHTQHRSPLDSYVIYLWSDLPPDPKASITDSFDHSCIQQHLAYSWCQYMFVERETTDPMFAEAGMWTDPSQPSFASPSCMCMVLGVASKGCSHHSSSGKRKAQIWTGKPTVEGSCPRGGGLPWGTDHRPSETSPGIWEAFILVELKDTQNNL